MIVTKEYAVKAATNYVRRNEIYDEDKVQDIYLAALELESVETSNPSAKLKRAFDKIATKTVEEECEITEDVEMNLFNCLWESTVNEFTNLITRNCIDKVLSELNEREIKVLNMRFGLDGSEPMTLEAIGKEFKVSGSRIMQIEAKALRKLRYPSRSRQLRELL